MKLSRAGGEAPGIPQLRRANGAKEFVHLALQHRAVLAELTRGLEHTAGRAAGMLRGFGHAADVRRHFLRALGGLLDVAGDLLGRRTLLLDRRSDRSGDL